MKKLVFLLAIFSVLTLNAQNYQITFSGTGASTTVSTVKVENLNTGTSLTLNGSDILRLTITTDINSPKDNQSSDLRIYPNPMADYTTLEICPPLSGNAVIEVSEMTGKSVYKIQNYLGTLKQSFKLTGLKTGIYIVNIKGNGYQLSGKLVSNGNSNGAISIEKNNSIAQSVDIKKSGKESKSSLAIVDMLYATGNRLKFTGISGNYSTVTTDIPASDKTITFDFVACTDGDNNNYPSVTIGTQVWMAANLKTTMYNAGNVITSVTDNTAWSTNTTGAYCNYSNTLANSDIYGRLYNWYVVAPTNPKKVCPVGWHVPTDAEWTTLTTYLGGASVAGGKLKETTTTHWSSPNTGATNETGFTALPGGYRDVSGSFGLIGIYGFWWSSSISGTTYALYRDIINSNGSIAGGDNDQHAGSYVRCLKD